MARLLTRQPNGKYALFSTIEDNFILEDADPQEIIDWYIENFKTEIVKDINTRIYYLDIERGGGGTISYEEALEAIQIRREYNNGEEYQEEYDEEYEEQE